RKTQTFAAMGGMNQDDSVVTPSANAAGRNSFGLGDYKYALNARIGSSKSDNFGDVEILKGTVEVTDYRVRGVVNTNPDFSGGLTGWSQVAVSGGTPWAVITGVSFAFGVSGISDILYQSISPTGKRMGLRVKISVGFLTRTSSVSLVFLNGST